MIEGSAETGSWISLRGAAKSYGGVRALHPTDLDLRANRVYGVIGPNGAGKSTLMKLLAGIVRPDGGELLVDGARCEWATPREAMRQGVVMMPQEITVVPDFSVAENITLGDEPLRRGLQSRRLARRTASEALEKIGLDLDPRVRAGDLPAVEKRLMMVATAVNRQARLLILDEPTAGLPEADAQHVLDMVVRLRDHGITIVYVSHHLSEVATLSDHVLTIREGRLDTQFEGDEISRDVLVREMTKGVNTTIDSADREAAALASPGEGISLESVSGARLRDVSIAAPRGQVLGIAGLLGSGVSEAIAMFSGVGKPSEGSVRFGGEKLDCGSPAVALSRGIGALAGDRTRSGFATMSVRENASVSALRKWFGRAGLIRRRRERAMADQSLDLLSVKGDRGRALSALSGGNQQRVLVSRLLAADLEVMVFDDPTIGVDIASRAELWEHVRALRENRSIIVASSELDEFVALCDEVVCLRDGRISAVLAGPAITERAIAEAIV